MFQLMVSSRNGPTGAHAATPVGGAVRRETDPVSVLSLGARGVKEKLMKPSIVTHRAAQVGLCLSVCAPYPMWC